MYDGARQLFDTDNTALPIDIKTICKTGTSGAISIPPSRNKSWLRKLGICDILSMPDSFVDFYIDKIKKHDTKSPKIAKTYDNDITPTPTYDAVNSEFVVDLVKCLSPKRAVNYSQWIALGWCLHNISTDLLPIWIEFSKQSKKFKSGECDIVWNNMRNTGYNFGTLRMWAKSDNSERYKELKPIVNKETARFFYAKVLSAIEDFDKYIFHIVNNVLKITFDCKYKVLKNNYIKYNFGFRNLNDSIHFKFIVQYFCEFGCTALKKYKAQFDPDIYFHVPTTTDQMFFIEEIDDMCDRYIVKAVKKHMNFNNFDKTRLRNNLYRNITYYVKPFDLIIPNHIQTKYTFFLLSCIPTPQHFNVWFTIGNILKQLKYTIDDFINWDVEREDLAKEYWDSFKAQDYYNNRLLHFIATFYVKTCKQYFEHYKMVTELYVEDNEVNNNLLAFTDIKEIYNSDIVDPIDARCKAFDLINYDLYASFSPLGSGKSYRSIEAIKPLLLENTSIIVPTSRQTYADNITPRYIQGFSQKFLCYKDAANTKELQMADKVVIQLESMRKLNRDTFDFAILDEIMSLLSQFSSETMQRRFEDSLEKFLHYICHAKKIIMCDAFYSKNLLNFVRFIKRNHVNKDLRIMMSYNEGKTIARKAYKIGTVTGRNKEKILKKLLHYIFQKLEAKKKIAIVSASKKDLDNIIYNIKKKYPQLKVQRYTSDTDDNDCQRELKDCEKYWLDLDIVAWSSKILIGVNFSLENVYDSIFVIGDNTTCLVRDMHQSIMRIRHLISDEIYYVINEFDCKEKRNQIAYDLSYYIAKYVHESTFTDYNDQMTKYKEYITYLLAYNEFEQYISRRCYTQEFERLLLQQNYTIIDISEKIIEDINIDFSKINTDNGDAYSLITTFIAENMDKIQDIENRVTKYKASQNDRSVMKVYYFNKLFRMNFEFEYWKELFACYEKFLLHLRSEFLSKKYDNIDDLIKYNKGSLFESVNLNKLKFMLRFHKQLGMKHSLDFEKIFKKEDLIAFYEVFKDELKDIQTLFEVKSIMKLNDGNKDRFIANYLNYIFMDWMGVNVKSNEVVNKRTNVGRLRVYSHSLKKTDKPKDLYEHLISNEILEKYNNLLYDHKEDAISYMIADNDELEVKF
jgi:hypothetical protein